MDPVILSLMFGAQLGLDVFQTNQMNSIERKQAESNAKFAALQAESVIRQGRDQAAQLQRQIDQFQKNQLLNYAAGNVNINTEIAQETAIETAKLGMQDTLQVMNNAWLKSFGINYQAGQNISQADMNAATRQTQMLTKNIGRGINYMVGNARANAADATGNFSPATGNDNFSRNGGVFGGDTIGNYDFKIDILPDYFGN